MTLWRAYMSFFYRKVCPIEQELFRGRIARIKKMLADADAPDKGAVLSGRLATARETGYILIRQNVQIRKNYKFFTIFVILFQKHVHEAVCETPSLLQYL